MLQIGIVGTSAISHQFIDAAHQSGSYQLKAVYSRTLEKAQDFSQPYQDVSLYTDWADFLQANYDLLYIASPNSLHFQQAMEALAAGKHVIIEKPMVSTPAELVQLRSLAQEKQVFLFEAARNYHEAAFDTIRQFLADKTIWGAYLGYAKYSSKMPELLAGGQPNSLSAAFSGGALMDLGIYPVYAAHALFGKPQTARYLAQQLPSSVDLNGSGQLVYEDFFVTIHAGKNITSNLASEVYTDQGTLTLNSCQQIESAVFTNHKGQSQQIDLGPIPENNMLEEVRAFAAVLASKDFDRANDWLDQAQSVHQTLYRMRQDAAISFKADTHEN